MVATAEQVAEATFLVDQFTAAQDQLKTQAAAAARTAWLSVESWYSVAAYAAVAREVAALSGAAQDLTTGISQQFVGAAVASLRGTTVQIPTVALPPVRKGADPVLVQMRAADTYRKAIATGSDHQEALDKALLRAEGSVTTDLSLRNRDAADGLMRELGVDRYRRIIHPELAKTGTCGLCIVAADRTYKTGNLMALHPPSCHCTVMPVLDGKDPGIELNRADLDRIYAVAGDSTKAEDLRLTRFRVDEHGEFGPYLSRAQDNFRGPSKVALEDDPERAAKMLDATLPTLLRLETAGGPADALKYQRDLVAKLRRITAAAA